MNCYLISQRRNDLLNINVPNEIKELLSEKDEEFYRLLATMSKIFDENPTVINLGIIISFIEDKLVIRDSIIYSESYGLILLKFKGVFVNNGFDYLELK